MSQNKNNRRVKRKHHELEDDRFSPEPFKRSKRTARYQNPFKFTNDKPVFFDTRNIWEYLRDFKKQTDAIIAQDDTQIIKNLIKTIQLKLDKQGSGSRPCQTIEILDKYKEKLMNYQCKHFIFISSVDKVDMTRDLADYHVPLPNNSIARINAETIIKEITGIKSAQVTIASIRHKYKKSHPSSHLPSKSTITRFVNRKHGMSYRRIPVNDYRYYEHQAKISRAMFLKGFIGLVKAEYEIVYYDECLFTLDNGHIKGWQGKEHRVSYKGICGYDKAMLALAVYKGKVVYYEFIEEYINADVFVKILGRLKDKCEADIGKSWVLYLDNASSHTSELAMEYIRENNMSVIYGAQYCSKFNLAELIFRHIKNIIYKELHPDM